MPKARSDRRDTKQAEGQTTPEPPLAEYRAKRDFAKTAEPSGETASATKQAIFVVHKHDASRLHYDFRLQIGDTMPSWAVLNPADKRLAVHVEDHPLDYAAFEGTIPAVEYGGGTVMIWDYGTVKFKAEGKTPAEWLAVGTLEFELFGRKLKGQWVLIHTKMGGNPKNWLLIKRKDEFARMAGEPDILVEQPDSAKTGRSLEQIAGEGRE